jgi:Zn-dependent metalloprotease
MNKVAKISTLIGISIALRVAAYCSEPLFTVRAGIPGDVAEAIKQFDAGLVVAEHPDGLPSFVRARFGRVVGGGTHTFSESELHAILARAAPIFRLKLTDLVFHGVQTEKSGNRHFRYHQMLNGMPVDGAELIVHVNRENEVYAINGTARGDLTATSRPRLLPDAARVKVRECGYESLEVVGGPSLCYVLGGVDGPARLAYRMVVGAVRKGRHVSERVYLDANSGEVVRCESLVAYLDRNIYDDRQQYWALGLGTLVRSGNDESSSFCSDSQANSAFDRVGQVFAYFQNVVGRNSYDGNGAPLHVCVHATFNYAGTDRSNAEWIGDEGPNGTAFSLAFGDGGGIFGDLSTSIDVTAHELTHGIVNFTSGLALENESGALNEGFADIMAVACRRWRTGGAPTAETWKFASDVYTPSIPNDALRYLDHPFAGNQRDYYPDRDLDPLYDDNGGIHTNAGIATLAFYLAVHGGSHPRGMTTNTVVPLDSNATVSFQKAEMIFYSAFTGYLTKLSDFATARIATAEAARDLYSNTEATIINEAWDAVGVPVTIDAVHPVNISARTYVGSGENCLIAGFSLSGAGPSKSLLVRGVGPTLTNFGVTNVLSNPKLDVTTGNNQNIVASCDNWNNDPVLSSAATDAGAFQLNANSLDAAAKILVGAGSYTAVVSGVNGATGNGMVEVYDCDTSNPVRITNLSTRALVVGGQPIQPGFVITGSGYKRLLIRAVGPTLSGFGINNALSDPVIKLYFNGVVIQMNDDWSKNVNAGSVAAAAEQAGAFALPTNSKDSALLVYLPPGQYTAEISASDGVGSGVALAEVYVIP